MGVAGPGYMSTSPTIAQAQVASRATTARPKATRSSPTCPTRSQAPTTGVTLLLAVFFFAVPALSMLCLLHKVHHIRSIKGESTTGVSHVGEFAGTRRGGDGVGAALEAAIFISNTTIYS